VGLDVALHDDADAVEGVERGHLAGEAVLVPVPLRRIEHADHHRVRHVEAD